MSESSAGPGRLQATFVPALATLAWWGVADVESALTALGLPPGSATTCRLAVPVDGATVAPRTVGVRAADLSAVLPALRRLDVGADQVGASVRAWHRAALLLGRDDDAAWAELARTMPTAAHACLRGDETAVGTAASTLRQFAAAAGTGRELAAAGIRVTLRPYQIHGVTWLRALAGEGGGILADEMGLGKTLQAISLLATRAGSGPHLVVCPTSVIGNWRRELGRFAPDLPVVVHHGASRGLPATVPDAAVVLTSYSVLRTDADELTAVAWDCVVLDEAQQIKNPTSLAAKAAARLPATVKVAMTGTPVENRLEELWSLLHVTNPAVLGTRARFRQRFATPIESGRSRTAAERLATVVGPYVLRRTKSQVATELPPKQFSTVACTLTDEQTRLYRAAVADAFASGLGSGIARRGNVLALLTTLKQVCNHPAQAGPGGDSGKLVGRSGKFDRATEMLAEIVADGDRALVFTQYRGMGELLSTHLTAELGAGTIPFLHGGLSVERRDRLVDDFQTGPDAAPVLILSLRAAGFGLNLTRASHVLHYDRWWNPAVEAQATDRAHRIGQRRTVNVYTLVTGGTIEDHIAAMHESKRALAESVTGTTEAALADLPDTELRALLDLDAIGVC
ncbi:DEAD/DEAH box helicase [Rhodococcus tukisamuensis]|uniref:Helicase conserved C-terminal domain-containing protein n=1 Tax=Rhodococcus tukisamuensis TaxID=168276 RepID=A0A1G6MHJ6_9NOCA|nr:DEAD/DEAH box helicase [Rhodococcus tukisamuensis]SDC54466.1 Helicase conserved C-terminal domain-containing protein [Rhodococcus tukisamuensis]